MAVLLSADPLRELTIALTATPAGGADAGDYELPGSVSFAGGETAQTITVIATDDHVDDDQESVVLGLRDVAGGSERGHPADHDGKLRLPDLSRNRMTRRAANRWPSRRPA